MKNKIYLISLLSILFFGVLNSCNQAKSSKLITIGMVDGWSENIAITQVTKAILDEKGYNVVIQKASTDMILASMNNEDTDLFLGVWLPYTHASKVKKFPELKALGDLYDNGKIGLVVPDYVPVNSISELNRYQKQFNNSIIGIEKGAGITSKTDQAIKDYHLDYQQVNSSTVAMNTELQNAIRRKEWIAVCAWQPHWIFGKMKLKFLQDPKNIFGDSETIKAYSRKSFAEDHPELTTFFSKMHFSDADLSQLLVAMENSKNKEETAKIWVKNHQILVDSWFAK